MSDISNELDEAKRRIKLLEVTLYKVTNFLANRRSMNSAGWWNDHPLADVVREAETVMGRRIPT